MDPYELWNLAAKQDGSLPPHPRPGTYRAFVFAAAEWCEKQNMEALKLIVESNGMKVTGGF